MIGANFLFRLLSLAGYAIIVLVVISVFTIGLTWVWRMFVQAHLISFSNHMGWIAGTPVKAFRVAWRAFLNEMKMPKSE